ncbi:hypothetical protein HD554DRAFT_38712 [Boletus coccyginus]|nr:hypothetical protein HD554DRAFT_38712 [Boletus coccyginus]
MTSATGHFLGPTPECIVDFGLVGRPHFRIELGRPRHLWSWLLTEPKEPRGLILLHYLLLDQGHLGIVLSMSPRGRLSHGILMPLFPSMFGQLNAIAREYNFPSTIGLCLYLHINESGITMTPRISDDSWQYLSGHLFDGRPPSGGHQLPIGRSIEFDIDLNKARWFDAWVSGTSRALLEAHRRGESLLHPRCGRIR